MHPGIAISGRAGSGKTTMGAALVSVLDAYGIQAERIAFGDQLKREVYEKYGITKDMVGGRDVLIRYGEERRRIDPDYWIRPVANRVGMAQVCGIVAVVDDMRFKREYNWALERGMSLVRMLATPEWRQARLAAQGLDAQFAYSEEIGETDLRGLRHMFNVRNGDHYTNLNGRALTICDSLRLIDATVR